jgi:hypothetical protein
MTPEVHVVVLWPRAVAHADEILVDLASRFCLLDVVQLQWSADRFSHCLTRFYEDSTMAAGSSKERHIGVGPFLVAVVEDDDPAYERRKTTRGAAVVHAEMFDAKTHYRRLTGGGHLVHGSVSAAEADRDLFFLLRRRAGSFSGNDQVWDGVVKRQVGNVVGVDGWRDRAELLLDLELSLPYVLLDVGPPLTVLLAERWWSGVVAAVHGQRRRASRLSIPVDGEPLELVVGHVGDGSLGRSRQRSLLRDRVRGAAGAFVPRDEDEREAARAALADKAAKLPRWQRLLSALR